MALSDSETLAKDVLNGSYIPNPVTNCDASLPLDRNPQVFRFVQLILVHNANVSSRPHPEYLIIPPDRLFHPDGDRRQFTSAVKRQVEAIGQRLFLDNPVKTYPPADENRIEEIRSVIKTNCDAPNRDYPGKPAGTMQAIQLEGAESDATLLAHYSDWRSSLEQGWVADKLEPLRAAGLSLFEPFASDALSTWVEGVTAALLPEQFQPLSSPYPMLAGCSVFEQSWDLKGYTRGELINTISVSPGETLTVEVHTWDKSTSSSEEELSQESELRSSEKITQRDALTVVQEYARKQSIGVNANLSIPLTKISIGFSANVAEEIIRRNQETREELQEGIFEASQSLKASRKLRIEASREVGREEKQTRTIQNTNRCRTLNCHYFEIMANYLVTTKLLSVQPCVLIANPRFEATLASVLCYEDVLKQALLDKTFLPGFDAARRLRANEIVAEAKRKNEDAPTPQRDPGPDRSAQLLAAIVDAARPVLASLRGFRDSVIRNLSVAGSSSNLVIVTVATAGVGRAEMGILVYRGSLNGKALGALNTLNEARVNRPPIDALRDFFAMVTPADFHGVTVPTLIAQNLRDGGLPDPITSTLLSNGFLEIPADDNGVIRAIDAANAALSVSSGPVIGQFVGPTDPVTASKTAEELRSEATDRVAFEQLKCHLEKHILHYSQAIWLREDEDERFLRLSRQTNLLPAIRNEILGFVADRAAYPIANLPNLGQNMNFVAVVNRAEREARPLEPKPQLITVPTHGAVLEALLGECDGCEEYIRDSRIVDLRLNNAKAAQAQLEAKRRRLRLEAQPPDLSDPVRFHDGRVVINVDNESGENGDDTETET